ncbi:MAG: Tex family protein [Sporolactobacillus sp.]
MEQLARAIAAQLALKPQHVDHVIDLLTKENTIPFIARYRKEMTGGMDEVQIETIQRLYSYGCQLQQRKEEVLKRMDDQGVSDPLLRQQIIAARKLQEVEDLYLPFKPKRRTRAVIAKEKGLGPLANWLIERPSQSAEEKAVQFLSEEKGVETVAAAIEGACAIIAERLAERADLRSLCRRHAVAQGLLCVQKGKEAAKDEKKVYEMYYTYEEKASRIVPHRVLAINRGEKSGILKVTITFPETAIFTEMNRLLFRGKPAVTDGLLHATVEDACHRLIFPAVARELRQNLTEKAEKQAIHIFSENLRGLLLQPPMKEKTVLGVDPAYRTGCKLAVVHPTGKLLAHSLIYPTPPKSEIAEAQAVVLELIARFHISVIAIGNGTASRETEAFIAETIKQADHDVSYILVNEAGASVYSASSLAREEFPDLHVEERSAISIARRLQDPLAELVKIDPKSVGVGEYQHDVSEKELSQSLRFVVETVVNQVGVNVNTASVELLQHVAGLSRAVAANLVARRSALGKYSRREQLMDVPRLGPRAYEQCAGFLRISGGEEPLDNTPIHPESYRETKQLLTKIDGTEAMLGQPELIEKLKQIDIAETAAELGMGEPTLRDIVDSLIRPGRDPRDELRKPLLKKDILKMEDLRKGMKLEGVVRNVVDFGAFIDIGVKQDGLVHLSKMSHHFVRHPLDVVSVGTIATVWVEDVSIEKGRIALTMCDPLK